MAPQAPETGVSDIQLDQDARDATLFMKHHDGTEKPEIDLNICKIYENLQNMDWSKMVWRNVILFTLLHLYSIYGAWLVLSFQVHWKTMLWAYCLYCTAVIGTTMGAHRLWAHRSFKAKMPLRICLMIFQTIAFQNTIFEWSRDHRGHHRYSETDADPHNGRRGFFFSHMGWLMMRKHPKVIEKGRHLDLSDLEGDSVVMWQKRNYLWMVVVMCFVIPTIVPWYFWDEELNKALMVAGFLRYTFFLHVTWCINSVAHWMGSKPFDKSIYPSQNTLLSFFAMGEGWHNYHHVFPWDYRTSELGGWLNSAINLNATTIIIDLFDVVGQVYDKKTISPEIWKRRMNRTGDGSYRKETTTPSKND